MAKVLQFMNGSTLYEAEPVKIERIITGYSLENGRIRDLLMEVSAGTFCDTIADR
ncbi:MAG: hypothetical protein J6W00_13580 [Lentisphaeria bacterium]|nr:hypothetical protein [Lentisphaeria bacterium]